MSCPGASSFQRGGQMDGTLIINEIVAPGKMTNGYKWIQMGDHFAFIPWG
jgi:hypothetical protein